MTRETIVRWFVESTVWNGTRWEWVQLSRHRSRAAAVRASEKAQRRATMTGIGVRIVEQRLRDGWIISHSSTEVKAI